MDPLSAAKAMYSRYSDDDLLLECARQAMIEDNGTPLEAFKAEYSSYTRDQLINECANFRHENPKILNLSTSAFTQQDDEMIDVDFRHKRLKQESNEPSKCFAAAGLGASGNVSIGDSGPNHTFEVDLQFQPVKRQQTRYRSSQRAFRNQVSTKLNENSQPIQKPDAFIFDMSPPPTMVDFNLCKLNAPKETVAFNTSNDAEDDEDDDLEMALEKAMTADAEPESAESEHIKALRRDLMSVQGENKQQADQIRSKDEQIANLQAVNRRVNQAAKEHNEHRLAAEKQERESGQQNVLLQYQVGELNNEKGRADETEENLKKAEEEVARLAQRFQAQAQQTREARKQRDTHEEKSKEFSGKFTRAQHMAKENAKRADESEERRQAAVRWSNDLQDRFDELQKKFDATLQQKNHVEPGLQYNHEEMIWQLPATQSQNGYPIEQGQYGQQTMLDQTQTAAALSSVFNGFQHFQESNSESCQSILHHVIKKDRKHTKAYKAFVKGQQKRLRGITKVVAVKRKSFDLKTRITGLETKLSQEEGKVARLELELSGSNETVRGLHANVKQLGETVKSSNKKLSEAEKEVRQLETKLDDQKGEITTLANDLSESVKDTQRLQADLLGEESKNESLNGQLTESRAKVQELEENVETEIKKVSNIQSELDIKEEFPVSIEEHELLQGQVDKLVDDLAAMTRQRDQKDREIESQDSTLRFMEGLRSKNKKQIESLVESEKLQAQKIEDLEREHSMKFEQSVGAKSEVDEIYELKSTAKRYKAELFELKNTVKIKDAELNRRSDRICELDTIIRRSEMDKFKGKQSRGVHQFFAEIDLQEENQKLRKTLAEKTDEILSIQSKVVKGDQEYSTKEPELEKVRVEKINLSSDYQTASLQLDSGVEKSAEYILDSYSGNSKVIAGGGSVNIWPVVLADIEEAASYTEIPNIKHNTKSGSRAGSQLPTWKLVSLICMAIFLAASMIFCFGPLRQSASSVVSPGGSGYPFSETMFQANIGSETYTRQSTYTPAPTVTETASQISTITRTRYSTETVYKLFVSEYPTETYSTAVVPLRSNLLNPRIVYANPNTIVVATSSLFSIFIVWWVYGLIGR